ncbi:homogentisate 1,2-dioxygenase [Actinacidiphila sp. DG2A-62]|uniref:homogentisate 1,2-dioxygenase n=1 Tax=Actinacidiphila sp. DG2A-62 TaxID=3108821 RepID=UPI002DB6258D|nr:homogentisate 1,2-dioxygenase [Actinacidiphila sp. DG2A-62]MEC3997085.1 homogentisate 1,2-dioxygenase [Actinacidiphila sp. DG2A-62]
MYAKHSQGTVNRQAHLRWPEGTFEEHHGRDGFAGDCSQLYRRHPTTAWTRVEGPISPRGIQLDEIPAEDAEDLRATPTLLMYNADMKVSVSRRSTPTPYYIRNTDGDVTILTQRGTGRLVCDYGVLEYGPLEYLVIPKGTNYKLIPEGGETLAYIIETRSAIRIPDRGLLGQFLPFDIGVLDTPQLERNEPPSQEQGEWEIVVKREEQLSSIFYPFDPLDVEGWQGSVTPFRLRLSDIRPLTSERLDVPPVTHATFEAEGVWIVTMCPRPLQTGDAAPIQPYHRNVDYDEIMLMLGGGDPIPGGPKDGFTAVVPGGMSHGPNAMMLEMSGKGLFTRMPMYMLNIDTLRAVHFTDAFKQYEIPDYSAAEKFNAGPPGAH